MIRLSRREYRSGGTRGLRPLRGYLLAMSALLVSGGAGWGGYLLGMHRAPQEAQLASSLRALFDSERRSLENEKHRTEEHLNGLALRLGKQQAQLLRLEAMGERLVEMGHLDAMEFDFTDPPPVGGPEDPGQLSTSLPEMMDDLKQLARRIEDRELKLAMLEELMLNRDVQQAAHPGGRPVKSGWISSYYGWRKDPINGRKAFHRGLDFAGKPGSDILAVADGVVKFAGTKTGFGKTVEIRHGNGYVTRYAHNRKLLVEPGDLVHQGQVIAKMGNSGRSTGTHLHFEVIRNDKSVNPLKFVKKGRKQKAG